MEYRNGVEIFLYVSVVSPALNICTISTSCITKKLRPHEASEKSSWAYHGPQIQNAFSARAEAE